MGSAAKVLLELLNALDSEERQRSLDALAELRGLVARSEYPLVEESVDEFLGARGLVVSW